MAFRRKISFRSLPVFHRVLRCVPCTVLALAPCFATAHVFCAVDAAGFQAALDAASDGGAFNGEDNSIGLVAGTFSTHANGDRPFTYSSSAPHALYVNGGASINCAAFARNPSATVLSGHHQNPALVAHVSDANGAFYIGEATIQDGESTQDGGGISVNAAPGDKGAVTLAYDIVRNNHTAAKGGGVYLRSALNGGVSVYNTVIADNSADVDWGAGELVAADANSLVLMVSDDIVENTVSAAGATGGIFLGGAGALIVDFSIFAHNHNVGLHLDNARGSLYYVDCGTLGGTAPASAIGFTTADPRFVDYTATPPDLHLASGSPLLAAAPYSAVLEPYDIEGQPIPSTGKVDYGAYEDTVFATGFEG
jgi:hypothetical protein